LACEFDFRIVISLEARADLRKINRFSIEAWGVATANAYHNSILAEFDILRSSPFIGKIHSLDYAIRVRPCSRHRIYYRVTDDAILILRITHERQHEPFA
jgi:plasmid stabilization system protein ParE